MKEVEVWRPILGFELLYQASNFGRIKSLKFGREKILKPRLGKCGYQLVMLCKDGKGKNYRIHRLVFEAFNGKIPEGLVVNHLNEIKTDNRLDNLEICTHKENINYGTCRARMSAARKGKKFSEEHKRKISAARKAYWKRKKAGTIFYNIPDKLAEFIERKIKEDYPLHNVKREA